jgi:predicted membrane channel-forming protein YqfA (hemolysin III family)
LLYVVMPVIGAVITLYLLTQLDSRAITLGLSWLVVGIVVLAVTSRGFKQLPPEIGVDEVESSAAETGVR